MLQRAMNTRQGQDTSSYLINKLLTDNFKAFTLFTNPIVIICFVYFGWLSVMSAARKLQLEMDRTNKKVQEGLQEFDDIWDKLQDNENANSKEKLETELKNKIKKLQRHREQIKVWIQNTDIKDKQFLLDARRSIEVRMEKHKEIERQVKTKAFSKAGLGRQDRLDPQEQAKIEMTDFLNQTIGTLQEQIETFEAEIEEQQSAKAGKKGKAAGRVTELEKALDLHRQHVMRIEQILRCLDNEELCVDDLEDISFKDMMQDYVDRCQEDPEDFEDPDDLYGELIETLESMASTQPVVVTPPAPSRSGKIDSSEKEQEREREKERQAAQALKAQLGREAKDEDNNNHISSKKTAKKSDSSTLAEKSKEKEREREREKEKEKEVPVSSTTSIRTLNPGALASAKIVSPATSTQEPTPVVAPQVTMASLLKQEDPTVPQPQSSNAVDQKPAIDQSSAQVSDGDPQIDMPLQKIQQQFNKWSVGPPDVGQGQIQDKAQSNIAAATATKGETSQMFQALQVAQNQPATTAVASAPPDAESPTIDNNLPQQQQPNLSFLSNPAEAVLSPSPTVVDPSQQQRNASNLVQLTNNLNDTVSQLQHQQQQQQIQQQQQQPQLQQQGAGVLQSVSPLLQTNRGVLAHPMHLLNMLDQSLRQGIPTIGDITWDRYPNLKTPSPVQVPASYPTQKLARFNDPSFFEQQDMEVLFFAFHLQPGTYQQYLAAYELNKLSWRYHKHHQAWFQRHEQPIQDMQDYEYGNYVYFDYNLTNQQDQVGWCYRLKENFTLKLDALAETLAPPTTKKSGEDAQQQLQQQQLQTPNELAINKQS
eukprot:TRINITY_DN4878_c0_g2_i1.p1 TRINITY_DN4878_c0_g2~~TRINITY_DN4878_c0_g2_i1.p1  ORF type:complete len:820 (-),score=108.68 TRINITY_DN4878_c0_g2_i1:632-3091(-)